MQQKKVKSVTQTSGIEFEGVRVAQTVRTKVIDRIEKKGSRASLLATEALIYSGHSQLFLPFFEYIGIKTG